MKHYPQLAKKLREQLAHVEPILINGIKYFPCSVYTVNGQFLPCVYIVEADGYFKHWGIWPEDDHAKYSIPLGEVSSIADSPNRLPAKFAARIYKAGESGMGYHSFSIKFNNGFEQKYIGGGAIDFINYPKELNQNDIKDITLYSGTLGELLSSPTYYWCLYDASSPS